MKLSQTTRDMLKDVRAKALDDFLYFRVNVLKRQFLAGNEFQEGLTAFVGSTGGKPIKVVRVPRAHGKTTAVIDDVAWRICRNRNERILLSGPTRDHARAILGALKQLVLKNHMLRRLFPDVWPEDPQNDCVWWVKDRIQLVRDVDNKNPTVETAGVDSGTTGSHYTRIYLDDQVNDDNYRSRIMREGVWTHTLNCHALLDDTPDHPGAMIYTNTPWHPSDATMRLTSTECTFKDDIQLFEAGVYASGTADESLGVIWPEVRSEEFIAKQRSKGMRFFSPHYLMKPLAEGQHPFDVTNLQRFTMDVELDDFGVAQWTHPLGRDFFVHMSVDTNTNADTAADPAAIMVWAKDSAGHMWALDKKKLKGPTTPQLMDAMHQMFMRWRPLSEFVELKGKEDRFYYELLQYGLRKNVMYPINKLTRGGRTSRSSKFSRIVPMAVAVSDGRFHVPDDPLWQDFIEEMDLFDEKCEHDDQMDCVADIYNHGRAPIANERETEPEEPQGAGLLRVFVGNLPANNAVSRMCVSRDARLRV